MTTDGGIFTLLLRCCGPMQSWGIDSNFNDRFTENVPSKSGIVGIVAASLGCERSHPLDALAGLRMGVRVDVEGTPTTDFQTVAGGNVPKAARSNEIQEDTAKRIQKFLSGNDMNRNASIVSDRHYLQDAMFLVGLEGTDRALLERIDAALRAPFYPIGLGRRGYLPSVPVPLPGSGIRDGGLREALASTPWPIAFLGFAPLATDDSNDRRFSIPWTYRRVARESLKDDALELRAVIEATGTESDVIRQDQPIGAAFATRMFGPRGVLYETVRVSTAHVLKGAMP